MDKRRIQSDCLKPNWLLKPYQDSQSDGTYILYTQLLLAATHENRMLTGVASCHLNVGDALIL